MQRSGVSQEPGLCYRHYRNATDVPTGVTYCISSTATNVIPFNRSSIDFIDLCDAICTSSFLFSRSSSTILFSRSFITNPCVDTVFTLSKYNTLNTTTPTRRSVLHVVLKNQRCTARRLSLSVGFFFR